MKIETGLFPHMVVQRNRENVSEADFSGACATAGPVLATVRRGKGFASAPVGKAARGRMKGCLKGLPAGGPYTIEFRAGNEKLTIKDVLVGDVWLLGGQSNMQGCGLFPKKRLPADPQVRAFFMDDRWAVAKDPIHNLWACVDQVHIDLGDGVRSLKPAADWGVCPGPAFGIEMRRRTGVPQGLIACGFSCAEAMRLALVLGYDGPLKAWVDGKQLFHDPKGVNPANPEKAKASVHVAAGNHEVVLALGTNNGAAWGIHLRFERTDLSRAQRIKGPEHYVLPKVLG